MKVEVEVRGEGGRGRSGPKQRFAARSARIGPASHIHAHTRTHARKISPRTYIPPHICMYMYLHETLHRAGEGTEELLVTPLEVGLSW